MMVCYRLPVVFMCFCSECFPLPLGSLGWAWYSLGLQYNYFTCLLKSGYGRTLNQLREALHVWIDINFLFIHCSGIIELHVHVNMIVANSPSVQQRFKRNQTRKNLKMTDKHAGDYVFGRAASTLVLSLLSVR